MILKSEEGEIGPHQKITITSNLFKFLIMSNTIAIAILFYLFYWCYDHSIYGSSHEPYVIINNVESDASIWKKLNKFQHIDSVQAHRDILELAKLIKSESMHDSLDGYKTGQVIINRFYNYKFKPYKFKSVRNVICQIGQFDGAPQYDKDGVCIKRANSNYRIDDSQLSKKCLKIANDIYYGYIPDSLVLPENTVYFHNPKTATDSVWIRKVSRRPLVSVSQNGHYFYTN